MAPLRLAFAGSHEISWFCLKVLAEQCAMHGDQLAGVFNLPREQGAKHSAFVEFDQLAAEYHFPHHKVKSLSSPETLELLRSLDLDILLIVGWHRIVPQEVIDTAKHCLGMHSSLLPKDRGSSPINWIIIRGENLGGMSLFHLTVGVDSGDLVDQRGFEIGPDETCKEAYDKATIASMTLLRDNWIHFKSRRIPRIKQDESRVTLNDRRKPEDGLVSWNQPAHRLHAWIRALTHPYPGAFTTFRGKKLLLWKSRLAGAFEDRLTPGTLVSLGNGFAISTADGLLELLLLQFEGEPECSGPLFRALYQPAPGEVMG